MSNDQRTSWAPARNLSRQRTFFTVSAQECRGGPDNGDDGTFIHDRDALTCPIVTANERHSLDYSTYLDIHRHTPTTHTTMYLAEHQMKYALQRNMTDDKWIHECQAPVNWRPSILMIYRHLIGFVDLSRFTQTHNTHCHMTEQYMNAKPMWTRESAKMSCTAAAVVCIHSQVHAPGSSTSRPSLKIGLHIIIIHVTTRLPRIFCGSVRTIPGDNHSCRLRLYPPVTGLSRSDYLVNSFQVSMDFLSRVIGQTGGRTTLSPLEPKINRILPLTKKKIRSVPFSPMSCYGTVTCQWHNVGGYRLISQTSNVERDCSLDGCPLNDPVPASSPPDRLLVMVL
ncbi:hypothetical protein J6590_020623 [Homalodisca vitripennis]|nr:hypothetical protein J6590_020623 [Homalodisca vitripennis]